MKRDRPRLHRDGTRPSWRVAAALFALALAHRLLFWQATPDAGWGWSAFFKGDAPVWLAHARALLRGEPFVLGLPFRPPGMAYLLALVWDGRAAGIPWLRFLWLVQGALVAPLVYAAAVRGFGARVALAAGYLTAIATGPLLLSSALNNETPYLLLVVAGFALFERARASHPALAAFCAVQAAACLFRAEHALFALLALPLLGRTPARIALALAAFAAPLVPWHVSAWRAIERFNTTEPVRPPAEEAALRSVETAVANVRWGPEAARWRDALPAFGRRPASLFVAATVAWRGRSAVEANDRAILEEAFGYVPEPLPLFPFVASYGPLNFALANHAGASGGFDRRPLEQAPPLNGGAAQYPPFLVAGLPPRDLAFEYPPHLRLVVQGTSVGAAWIRRDPVGFLGLALRKLRIFWEGAALGVTGFNLPLGPSGTRRAVDLVTPDRGVLAAAWQLALFAFAAGAAWTHRRSQPLRPWLLFLLSRLAVTVVFFGYARQGALVVPVLALLAALVLEPRRPQGRLTLALAFAAPLVLELARFASAPAILIDGRPAGRDDPWPSDLHRDQRIELVHFPVDRRSGSVVHPRVQVPEH